MTAPTKTRTAKSNGTHFRQVAERLSAPFAANEVKFKPAIVSGNRALALAYVDARVIQDRLDDVLGFENWQDSYRVNDDGTVVCRLTIRIGKRVIRKMDVGSPSEQGDFGDRKKAAFSDALKRAAVKFGIGRYLYRFASQWCDYDPHKKQFRQTPRLPAIEKPRTLPMRDNSSPSKPPANGAELAARLQKYDEKLAKEGLCQPEDLLKHIVEQGKEKGFPEDLSTWTEPAIRFAIDATKAFESQLRQRKAEKGHAA